MKSNHISFILYSPFPNYSGGRETWLYNVIKRLDRMGFKITIYVYKDNSIKQFFDTAIFDNVVIRYCYTLESNKFLKKISRSYLKVLNLILFNIQIFFMTLFSSDEKFIALGPIIESLSMCWLKGIKHNNMYICSVRGLHAMMLSNSYPKLKKLWYYLEKYTLQKSDLVLCNGYDTQCYINKYNINSFVMPNGVDFDYFKNNSGDIEDSKSIIVEDNDIFYIVSTATIQSIKGIPSLLKSMFLLKNSTNLKYKVIWVGKGNTKAYDDEITSKNLTENIIFTGERKNTAEFLRRADLVLCLSGGGGMSMALLEAMAAGKIIIAWNTQIYTQLIEDGISGLLVEENNYVELAEKIKYVIKNKENLLKLGIEAQKIASNYDWDKITQTLIDYLEGEKYV
jgi:glycosyltransferase involved in cell wall biosynthesis